MAQTAYGIDVQGDEPVIVGVRRSGIRQNEYFGVDSADSGSLLRAPTAVAMPARGSLAQWLAVPYASARKARKVLPTLLDIQLPFALDQCVHDFVSQGKTINGEFEALAVAARNQDVSAFLDSLATTSLDPDIIDHEGLTLWAHSLVEHPVDGQSRRERIIVYAGRERGTLVLGRGRRFLNAHALSLADSGTAKRLIRAAFGDAPTELEWLWVGPEAASDSVQQIRVELEHSAAGEALMAAEPETFLARGLALRASQRDGMTVNFRSGPFHHADATEGSRRPRSTGGSAGGTDGRSIRF